MLNLTGKEKNNVRYFYMEKKNLPQFVEAVKKRRRLIAPVKKENQFVFAPVENFADISLDYKPTILPPKKYFFPQHEKLGDFLTGEAMMKDPTIEVEPLALFAVHTCDIEAIECLDIVFHEFPPDPYFRKRKKFILIIGYECMKPCDEHATCITMDTYNPKAGYDIMITDAGDKYIIHVNSEEGHELIEGNPLFRKKEDQGAIRGELLRLREEKVKRFNVALEAKYGELNRIFRDSRDSKVWEDIGKKCLSCGNCTAVCPTCYCFDIFDDTNLDLKSGERSRMWDSCQLDEFATVAGGENFRKERSSRQRHRYYRKFVYPVKKHNKFFCVGCGRCTRACMAQISLIETANALTRERKNAK